MRMVIMKLAFNQPIALLELPYALLSGFEKMYFSLLVFKIV